ncbi:tryptophan--tRNA ligase [Granulibacter bethesdensis]|uniref:Tryptophan--tRNA ligase n=1 Tax=Granulibacter bethesdensis (strain ATCC BAA-1260 / CGDNIH1) TaxID=391165 RepID=Q0BPD9_GRABC|nr:tryptophan--tRNA ligase [Granulibacter bethesdensis]ABI63313.1 Tryptophanyl-tRNA synthetase [Granulibacter bethesdensis CGDNIH1]AHJ69625.1 Tryptophanyl-tRNA synthetase [Granulibacter bethesdensis]APH53198.1 Tryptophanyl-tRNA synthetase [Granulibacter bethesdensis]APH60774.1 Tryptophanyl-tRNA synthetase [Granulibacter bethesdensis]APH65886.1 Tryptophanyl-tRNA synthetase [Granulibacter bethesdensis]
MKRIFSGIQPSGIPTLGNYLGALRNWVTLQDTHECLYCVVDMHAITVAQDPEKLRQSTREMAASVIACGVDPARNILFVQSSVSAHARLAWIFNCVARLGWLNRMTQFKDKAGKDRENASAGLYVYPNLMAADILAYHATLVPVGDDQRQHLELTNDIAEKFNHDFGVAFFPHVEPLIQGPAARVMSLRDGLRKMSKSDPSDQSRINLSDDADTIAMKIRRAKTDPEPLPEDIDGLEGRPEARNLVGIYAALTNSDTATVLREHGGKGFGPYKEALTELLVQELSPIAAETRRLLADEAELDRLLHDGGRRAEAIAEPIVAEAEKLVGFLRV